MNIFVTGATGFIGRALVLRLRRDGHDVTAMTRNPERARSLLGQEAVYVDADASAEALHAALERADAVVNLAGEPILGSRWDEDKKKRLWSSRVDLTRSLVEAMGRCATPPRTLVSGSAVGFYGNRGDVELSESADPGDGFLAELCKAWEAEALKAEDHGARVVVLRTGVVLGRAGGALEPMLPPFQFGVGGPVGPGTQYVPWIHLDDLLEMIVSALQVESWSGPINGSGPTPVTFRELASELGRVLNRPAFLPVPTVALKVIFGQAASVLVDSQRAIPQRAAALGFEFRYPTLREALADILNNDFVEVNGVRSGAELPESSYLDANKPAFELGTRVRIAKPLSEVFSFFSRAENLGLLTPPQMQFRITQPPERMEAGAEIKYRLKVGPVPISWTTRIDQWEENAVFVDSQEQGPYACWWHEHRFEADGNETVMTDRVLYAPPLGPLGRIANHVYVADELRRVFGYRSAVIRRRFGAAMR
ncbi:MAG: TIGR01777 family oxidoreductase [Rhodothermales bacterium]|nr:TIGR01777 family oxidoreductase [Rhodothermales bacterium]MBO6778601.1 TIGR01777 family oxidoreductase [Rhodothermales bacterium]